MTLGESLTKNRNSMKLDIEADRLSSAQSDSEVKLKESYKPLPESANNLELKDGSFGGKNSNMVREKTDNIEDGADESMLGAETEKLATNNEVKFISGDHQNGDAKIDIGELERVFSGMSKEELLKYANDPFWVRLRWIMFILFWGLWIAMLVGAILIIIGAPKCAAPTPLAWYKQGPLIKVDYRPAEKSVVDDIIKFGVRGVIIELPPNETYIVDQAVIRDKIKQIVDSYEGVNVIVDLTPNYVDEQDELFKSMMFNASLESAFIISHGANPPANWVSKLNTTAWHLLKNDTFILSQFGPNRFDLQMKDDYVKDRFKLVLKSLIDLGIIGFRLSNAKHFIINTDFKDEETSRIIPNTIHTEYLFWTHSQTTYQPELGELFHTYSLFVHNATDGNGFVSVNEPIERPEVFRIKDGNSLGIDLPIYGLLPHTLTLNGSATARHLYNELSNISIIAQRTWSQWPYDVNAVEKFNVDATAYNIFLMLLPGVPVGNLEIFTDQFQNNETLMGLEEIRQTPSFKYGAFDAHIDQSEKIVGYTIIKSGNPGYYVAYNPSDTDIVANLTTAPSIPEQMTVHMLSANYKVPDVIIKNKVVSSAVPITSRSAIILTYVPVASAA